MKHFILSISLLFSCITFSQDYIPMVEDGNAWSVVSLDHISGYAYTNDYAISGEEVINGLTYGILYFNDNMITCRLREENGILYSAQPPYDEETILLNLTLEIDDEFIWEYGCLSEGSGVIEKLKVINVYEDFIAGQNRKVITLQGYEYGGFPFEYFEDWIEGIGSTTAIGPLGGFHFDGSKHLTCFTNNDGTTFFNGYEQCEILATESFELSTIILSPNPISEKSILQLPSESEIDQLKIYNISGRLIKDIRITSDNYILKNMDYTSGLYFYQVSSNGKHIKTEKFIVK